MREISWSLVLLVSVFAGGCCGGGGPSETTTEVPTASAPAPMPSPPAPAPPLAAPTATEKAAPDPSVIRAEWHLAFFIDGNLDSCVDSEIEATPAADAGPGRAEELRSSLERVVKRAGTSEGGGVAVQRPCREQFTDRPVLAECAIPTKLLGTEILNSMKMSYYNPATVAVDDHYMQKCLRDGGDWTVPPR